MSPKCTMRISAGYYPAEMNAVSPHRIAGEWTYEARIECGTIDKVNRHRIRANGRRKQNKFAKRNKNKAKRPQNVTEMQVKQPIDTRRKAA